jgi:hypothetical protein
MQNEPTELDYLIKDRRCALEEIAGIEKMLADAKDDLRIADEGIARELAKL